MSNNKKFYMGNKRLKAEGFEETIGKVEFKKRVREIKRCKEDILYFAEKYFFIVSPDKGKHRIQMFDKQKQLVKSFQEFDRVVTLAARQTGKTTAYTVYLCWLMIFFKDKRILVCGNKQSTSKEIVSRVKLAFELLPLWLKPATTEWAGLSFALNNGSTIKGVATSASSARGDSINVLVIDEAAFIPPNIMDEFWQSVYPTISAPGGNTQVIMVSTPNGTGNLFYETYESARLGLEGGWHLEQMNWDDRPGRDAAWKDKTIASFNGDMQKWAQEFGNKFIGSSQTLFKPTAIEYFKSFIISDKWFEPTIIDLPKLPGEHINIKQWFKPHPSRTYAIGADVADGVGGDSSIALVFDITELYNIKQVASFASNVVSPTEFAYVLVKIGVMYNNAHILCESNNMGRSTLDFIYQIYEYEWIVNFGGKRNLGILSNHMIKIKTCLFSRSLTTAANVKIELYDKNAVAELEYFEKVVGGNTYKAIQGKYDDYTLSFIWLMFIFQPEIVDNYYDVRDWQTTTLGYSLPKVIRNFSVYGSGNMFNDALSAAIKDPDKVFEGLGDGTISEEAVGYFAGETDGGDDVMSSRGFSADSYSNEDTSWLFNT
jgi:hypothetical protein